jgi:hypothetical protein
MYGDKGPGTYICIHELGVNWEWDTSITHMLMYTDLGLKTSLLMKCSMFILLLFHMCSLLCFLEYRDLFSTMYVIL